MSLLTILTIITGLAMALSGFPQVIKIFKRKSAKDIAVSTYLLLEFGAFVWIFYGLEIKSLPVLLSNGVGLIATTLTLIGCYLYGRDGEIKVPSN